MNQLQAIRSFDSLDDFDQKTLLSTLNERFPNSLTKIILSYLEFEEKTYYTWEPKYNSFLFCDWCCTCRKQVEPPYTCSLGRCCRIEGSCQRKNPAEEQKTRQQQYWSRKRYLYQEQEVTCQTCDKVHQLYCRNCLFDDRQMFEYCEEEHVPQIQVMVD